MPNLAAPAKPAPRVRGYVATLTRDIRSKWSPAERAWRRQVAQLRLNQLLRQLDVGLA
jgi:hypothetical protein